MKDRIINEKHYDYANNIIKYFGFKNLSDFSVQVNYDELKKNQDMICTNINKTMKVFSKLFDLKKFDLARLDYKLKTVDHALSFLKKVLEYLYIPYDMQRIKKHTYLRLIQPNNIYIDYIKRMSEKECPISVKLTINTN